MVKCSFCGQNLKPGYGKMFVKKDGKIFYFCSNKCEKNLLKLRRKPIKIRWTEAYRKEKTKRLHTLKQKRKEQKRIE